MIALLGYPFAMEPKFRLASQTRLWAVGYIVLIAMTAWCAVLAIRGRRSEGGDSGEVAQPVDAAPPVSPLSWRERVRWIILAFVPSSYLLGATTFLTSDIAAVPLLWVVPLALYLLSFILVFARRQLLPQRWVLLAMPPAVAACVLVMVLHLREPLLLILSLHLLALLLVSMACHGELARRRPHPSRLTEFYLLLSLGGVLGGVFNSLLAPLLFVTPIEYPIIIALACLVVPRSGAEVPRPATRHIVRVVLDIGLPALLVLITFGVLITISIRQPTTLPRIGLVAIPLALALTMFRRPVNFGLCVAAIFCAVTMVDLANPGLQWIGRSFFGAHRVQKETIAHGLEFNDLLHGTTVHGRQRIDPKTGAPLDPRKPKSYYHPRGPLGQMMRELLTTRPPQRRARDVAVVGLGTGSIAAYAEAGTTLTFYEIDPLVKEIAENQALFTFVSDARQRRARVNIVLGDARLTLGDRAAADSLDLLVLDAFSGDAIPVHLLTREAMDRYVAKMRPGGIIAIHISNRYLNLAPVVYNLARHIGWHAIDCEDSLTDEDRVDGKYLSTWVLIARESDDFGLLASKLGWRPLPTYPQKFLWTDDFSNIVQLFTW
jgi:hypothetical protein